LYGHAVVAARGARRLRGVDVMALTANDGVVGPVRRMGCDLLCVSGGWTPSVHLFSQSGGRLAWDQGIAALVPAETGRAVIAAGAAAGALALHDCLAGGIAAGARAAADAGFDGATAPDVPDCAAEHAAPLRPLWMGPRGPGRRGKRFVDLQNDVTTDDLALAMREGYRSVEHVKRYTTLGMGTDQGRTGNVNGIGVLAVLGNTEPPAIGTIRFRPPYAPVALGTLAGRDTGAHFAPVRRTPMHAWHLDAGAELVTAGLWMRPRAYPRPGESVAQAVAREALAVRTGVGLVDVSTLGKIDIQGRDAALLLDRVYTNGWKSLRVGACRYGLMLRDDGMVFDDGTTSRIAEDRYYMTTTTAGAAEVMRHLEHALQVLWPELDVHLVSVSDPWAGMALAGPNARSVLAAVTEGMNVGAKAFPFLGYRQAVIAGTSVRLFRISYSGELAYEIHAPAERALEVWETVLDAGQPWAMVAYGTEAVGVLRTEKGHVVGGAEIDGRTTAGDLGLGGMLSTEKDFIGRRALERPGLADAGRKQLVGLRPVDGRTAIPAGAQLVAAPNHGEPAPAFGHVTSTAVSPNLGGPIALALLVDGRRRHGETVHAAAPLTGCSVPVTVSHPHFFDPEGERQRG
jgi:sarcosine oxidase subunit alpha